MFCRILIALTLVHAIYCTDGPELNDETRLVHALRDRYRIIGTDTRPVSKASDTLVLKFGITVIGVDDLTEVNEHHGHLTMTAWLKFMWNDIHLKWNPDDFGGVAQVRIPIDVIWSPDVFLYNSLNLELQIDSSSLAVVASDGSVLWIPPAKLKVWADKKDSTTCGPPAEEPDDEADDVDFDWEAIYKFGSWTYDGLKLDVDFSDDPPQAELTYYTPRLYNIVSSTGKKHVKKYPCCPEPYPDLTFNLKLKKIN